MRPPGAWPHKEKSESISRCIIYGETGHRASYRGCKYFKFAHQLKKEKDNFVKEKRNHRIGKIFNRVNSNRAYAQSVNNNNSDLINKMKDDVLNAITPKFVQIEAQINSNSHKINELAKAIGLKWK